MRESMLPATIFPNDTYSYKRDFTGFITQDEIDEYLTHHDTESKLRTLSHYLMSDGDKDFTAYLKDSFGIYGGGTHALGGADNSYAEHSRSKGIMMSRGRIGEPYAKVILNTNQAAKRVKTLIESGRFASRAELDGTASYEKLELVRDVTTFSAIFRRNTQDLFPAKPDSTPTNITTKTAGRFLTFTTRTKPNGKP
ncbi:hypothetical protein FACS189499_05520 [Clostridia bacterium]|nr:hypothetical protein FACS189499_05520 [Clostridia bacterium]